jgi:phospholipid/cholesterol/gamma-HCH transport system substrate-binding protein
MERDAHYFAVGIFVITTLIAGFFFTGLFISENDSEQLPYVVHFSTPVDGLIAGSEVRFMGVNVGEVSAVSLLTTPAGAARIAVSIEVLAETPVDTATVAVLRQQSLTGLMYLNLVQSASVASPVALSTSAEQPALIPTQLSEFDTLLAGLPGLENRLDSVLSTVEDLLNPDNRRTFAALLQHLEQTSQGLPALLDSLQQTGNQLTITAKSADQLMISATAQLDESAAGLNQTLAAIRTSAANIDVLTTGINRFVTDNEGKVATLLTQSRDDLHQLLVASRQTVSGIQGLVASMTNTSERLAITATRIGSASGEVSSGLSVSLQELNQTLGAIRKTAWQLNKLVTDVDRIVVTNEGGINELLGQGGEDMKQLLNEFRATALEVRQLSDRLEQDPSQIIYQPTPQGIELPR